MFVGMGHQRSASTEPYIDKKGEFWNEVIPWKGKLIGKLLLIVIMADPERFTFKGKPITYIRVFIEFYN